MKVQIWSDVVCPWCYIGKRRFEAALARFDAPVEVEWKSFQLDPSAPRLATQPIDTLLARKYRLSPEQARAMIDRVTREAAGEGLEFDLLGAVQVNTFDAHRLLQFAKCRGLGDAMKERLLRAHFTENATLLGQDLAELAADVGIDPAEALEILGSDAHADDVREDLAEARRLGITGVPFFLVEGQYGFAGAQLPDTMLQVLRQVRRSLVPDAADAADQCDDDNCAVD